MFPLEEVKQEAQSLKSELFEIYKDLHQHPESSWEEFRTSKIVEDYLRTLGLEVKTNIGYTGVVGVLDTGKPGKTLLLRADMDALLMDDLCGLPYQSENPGVCHSCGHDSHVAMLLGAAKILCTHKDAFSGRIKFAFQACDTSSCPREKENWTDLDTSTALIWGEICVSIISSNLERHSTLHSPSAH